MNHEDEQELLQNSRTQQSAWGSLVKKMEEFGNHLMRHDAEDKTRFDGVSKELRTITRLVESIDSDLDVVKTDVAVLKSKSERQARLSMRVGAIEKTEGKMKFNWPVAAVTIVIVIVVGILQLKDQLPPAVMASIGTGAILLAGALRSYLLPKADVAAKDKPEAKP